MSEKKRDSLYALFRNINLALWHLNSRRLLHISLLSSSSLYMCVKVTGKRAFPAAYAVVICKHRCRVGWEMGVVASSSSLDSRKMPHWQIPQSPCASAWVKGKQWLWCDGTWFWPACNPNRHEVHHKKSAVVRGAARKKYKANNVCAMTGLGGAVSVDSVVKWSGGKLRSGRTCQIW